MLLLILLPVEVDAITQEKSCKKNTIGAFGFSGGKVILIILTKIITFYVGLITIHIW